jgi:hypothetical protein
LDRSLGQGSSWSESGGPRFVELLVKATCVLSGLNTGSSARALPLSVPAASAETSVVVPAARSRT